MRIVQLTDLHILATPRATNFGIDTFHSFQGVLAAALEAKPEMIVISGDLAEDGKAASYKRIHELLLAAGIPVFVLPGNHDSVERMTNIFAQGSVRFQYMNEGDRWNFVFLNSQVAGESHGKFDEQAGEKLSQILLAHPEKQFLIALHHTPLASCSAPGCQLHGAEQMLLMLKEHENARVVIAGHVHMEARDEVGHLSILTTPATSAQIAHRPVVEASDVNGFWATHEVDVSRHGYRIIDLKNDGSFATEVHWVA